MAYSFPRSAWERTGRPLRGEVEDRRRATPPALPRRGASGPCVPTRSVGTRAVNGTPSMRSCERLLFFILEPPRSLDEPVSPGTALRRRRVPAQGNRATISRMHELSVRPLASRNLAEAGCVQILNQFSNLPGHFSSIFRTTSRTIPPPWPYLVRSGRWTCSC
jgi:hypothetical protein